MHRKLLSHALLLFCLTFMEEIKLNAMLCAIGKEQLRSRFTPSIYENREITPASLLQLLSALPQPEEIALQGWLKDHENLIRNLVTPDWLRATDLDEKVRKAYLDGLKKQVLEAGFKDLSDWNYVFRITLPITALCTKSYFIKIAGHVNRRQNIRDIAAGRAKNINDYGQDTYQGISRAAYTLRAHQFIQNNQCSSLLAVPQARLVRFPWAPANAPVIDQNYIVVEEDISDRAQPLPRAPSKEGEEETASPEELRLLIQRLTQHQKLLKRFIRYVGLWNMKDDDFIFSRNPAQNTLYRLDVEQPNNSKPHDFFLRNFEKYIADGNSGLAQFNELRQRLEARLQRAETQAKQKNLDPA